MGTVIAVASQKGGVGKTTTSLNLAFSLSRFGDKVLVLDADPQGSLAVASNLKKRTVRGLVHVLRKEVALSDVIAPTRDGQMSLVSLAASTPDDVILVEEAARSGALKELVQQMSGLYPQTVIDAPSGIGGLVTSLLSASDAVVLPVPPFSLMLRTLPAFLRTVQFARKTNEHLRIAGLLITMFDPESRADARVEAEIRESFPEDLLFRTVIPTDPIFEEASLRSLPVALMPGGHKIAGLYLQLAMELRERNLLWESNDVETSDLF